MIRARSQTHLGVAGVAGVLRDVGAGEALRERDGRPLEFSCSMPAEPLARRGHQRGTSRNTSPGGRTRGYGQNQTSGAGKDDTHTRYGWEGGGRIVFSRQVETP